MEKLDDVGWYDGFRAYKYSVHVLTFGTSRTGSGQSMTHASRNKGGSAAEGTVRKREPPFQGCKAPASDVNVEGALLSGELNQRRITPCA